MGAFDVARFVAERASTWAELERRLAALEGARGPTLDLAAARRLGQLYRATSNDLVRARTELVGADIIDHLNDLVARTHAQIHLRPRTTRGALRALRWFVHSYPREVRSEARALWLAGLLLGAGVVTGFAATHLHPPIGDVLIPEQFRTHLEQTPEERVAEEERAGGLESGSQALLFSSFLFTHNIQVTFLAFALGLTAGIGTALLLFFNGLPLGALAASYAASGRALFFWAWILPHGVLELTAIAIAGAAGFVVARGLVVPGSRRRRDALLAEARSGVRLVLGAMPVLVLAGFVEGTLSQMHAPVVPYAAKLVVAGLLALALGAFLAFGGRGTPSARASLAGAPAGASRVRPP